MTLNIHQRMLAARKEIPYLKKDLEVEMSRSKSYAGISHDLIMAATRKPLLKHGIDATFTTEYYNEEHIEIKKADGTTRSTNKATVFIKGTFINVDDPKDMVVSKMPACAYDNGDKSLGKAISYAVKYILLKECQIETGEDEESRVEYLNEIPPMKAKDFRKRLEDIGKDEGPFLEYVNYELGSEFKALEDVTKERLLWVERAIINAEKATKDKGKQAIKEAKEELDDGESKQPSSK